ncbi:cupredoxin domain-containing protein [Candidatus Pacearchaeota archaeon]|nr:cupredoxin domain-containing protein [Candidatus Pacearchaeota archaeon]
MKNTTLLFGIALIVLIAGGFLYFSGNNNVTGKVINNEEGTLKNGQVNEIALSMKDYNYYPNTITVKEGETVRISLDSSIYGCLRDFTIKDFGVRKYLKTPDDYVEFVADKKGTYSFACSMGMGFGKLIVE